MTKTRPAETAKPRKAAPSRRAKAVAVSEDELFRDDPSFRKSYRAALFAQEAARFVREMRKRKGLKQSELAKLLGVTQPRISRLEKASDGDGPSYAMVRRVAEVCGVAWTAPIPDLEER